MLERMVSHHHGKIALCWWAALHTMHYCHDCTAIRTHCVHAAWHVLVWSSERAASWCSDCVRLAMKGHHLLQPV